MTLQERIAAVIRKHLFTLYPGEIACDCEWTFGEAGSATSDDVLLDAWAAHAAALAADGEAASEDGTGREGLSDDEAKARRLMALAESHSWYANDGELSRVAVVIAAAQVYATLAARARVPEASGGPDDSLNMALDDLARAEKRLAAVEALADELCEFNPGHGDFLTAGKSIRAALAADEEADHG